MFTKIVNASAPESDDSSHPGLSGTPFTGNTTYSTIFNNVANTSLPWMRVLALEIFRGLCSDFDLLRRAFLKYDLPYLKQTPTSPAAGPTPANTGVVVPLLNAISRLASERPSLLGVGQQVMMGASSGGQEFTVSGMVDAALGGSGQGQAQTAQEFSAETSSIRLQCIDQLDKAESPPLPETYTYLLALQCLSAVAAGFHHSVTPMFNEYATQRCAADQTLSPAAPPPFIAESAENSQLSSSLGLIRDMADATWSSLLYSLSFFISTALSDDLFFQVLAAFQSFTATCGLLNLSTPRDAFIASLSKFALPSVVMASINATPGAPTPGSESNSFASKAGSAAAGVLATGADALGFTSPGQSSNAVLSLSLRNLQCLRSLLQLADQLAGMLGPTWYAICEAVTNSEYALRIRANAKRKPEETQALTAISRLFEGTSTSLDDDSFKAFIKALGKLSCEMIGLPLEAQDQPVSSISETVRKRANSVAPTKMLVRNRGYPSFQWR